MGGVTTFMSVKPGTLRDPARIDPKNFEQHLSLAPFEIGKGSVTVHYADGSSEIVPNVELSAPTIPRQGSALRPQSPLAFC